MKMCPVTVSMVEKHPCSIADPQFQANATGVSVFGFTAFAAEVMGRKSGGLWRQGFGNEKAPTGGGWG